MSSSSTVSPETAIRVAMAQAVKCTKTVEDQEDLSQSTLIRYFGAKFSGKITATTKLGKVSFIRAICRNLWVDRVRKREVLNEVALPIQGQSGELGPIDPNPSPSALASRREMFGRFHEVLPRLAENQRLVIEMTICKGMSLGEIATAMHKTPDEVRNLEYRARMKIGKFLNETLPSHSE
jgi:RNA polymerase sigma factor (sigma-70 family)